MADVDVPKEVVPETSSEHTTEEKKLSADAFQNFIQGKRHMLVQDYANAVTSLADACELYVEHFGQTAPECAEVYFHYGKALFRLFQQQAGIIGNLVSEESSNDDEEGDNSDSDKDNEKDNDDENENEEEEEESDGEDIGDDDEANKVESNAEAKGSEPAPEPKQAESSREQNDASAKQSSGEEKPEVSTTTTENEKPSDQNLDEAGPSSSKPKTEEEISDLQLAWETLETAKAIFIRQGDDSRESHLKVAEILMILAEISMELENYTGANDDLWECLKIREQYLEPDDRLIAETYYQMGLAHTFAKEADLALQNYQKSIDCIVLRINNLKKQTVIQKTPEGFDINPAEEISELEGILPDIQAKMEDTRDLGPDQNLKELMAKTEDQIASSDKPATNISHLLKRKKPEDQERGNQIETKRLKLTAVPVEEEQMKPDSSTPDSASNA